MSNRKLVKELTFFDRYSGSSKPNNGLAYSLVLKEMDKEFSAANWIWERANELVRSGNTSFRKAVIMARAEWYAPRDPEPWELD